MESGAQSKASFREKTSEELREQLEIERLLRDVTKLKAERDILKKAAAFFAREAT
jgi:transposase-like protein